MSLRQSLAGAMNFAHLVSPRAAPPVAAASPAAGPAADDGDDADLRQQLEEANKRAEEAEKRAEAAEEEVKKLKASEGDPDEDGDDDENEDGDDDSDKEEMALPAGNRIRAARLRERSRCAAIFADAAAGLNIPLAAQLAFAGDLPRSVALGILKAAGAGTPRRTALSDRMEGVNTPPVTPDAGPAPDASDPKQIAAGIIAAYDRATGLVRN